MQDSTHACRRWLGLFGIIKEVLGLRQFLLRGFEKLALEWELVCTAHNLNRLWALRAG